MDSISALLDHHRQLQDKLRGVLTELESFQTDAEKLLVRDHGVRTARNSPLPNLCGDSGSLFCEGSAVQSGLKIRSTSIIDTSYFYFGLDLGCIDADLCKLLLMFIANFAKY